MATKKKTRPRKTKPRLGARRQPETLRLRKLTPGFTSRYNLTRLVYYEQFVYPDAAISREKEMKAWRSSKKVALIESMNCKWDDLAGGWQDIVSRVKSRSLARW